MGELGRFLQDGEPREYAIKYNNPPQVPESTFDPNDPEYQARLEEHRREMDELERSRQRLKDEDEVFFPGMPD